MKQLRRKDKVYAGRHVWEVSDRPGKQLTIHLCHNILSGTFVHILVVGLSDVKILQCTRLNFVVSPFNSLVLEFAGQAGRVPHIPG